MNKVEIYSTPTCHFCQATKKFFKEHGVEYNDYNVAEDTVKRQEMMEKTGQMGVPVIVITSEGENPKTDVVVGFDEPKLSELLGL
ncbi:NrdH-redoxin [Candidatus Campbellbacteria bacterium CG11_big_fil_rev_8_21_14_0_20_44_21]|uniref:NrdH-redoxin n=1 Tax=Candidatus Campbellbacteria bacterium CG22_combo_CG10-13_8_21_14_all_43_18 TaxID=1974530 RepID=A0A2H0DXS3_9BACT|nr:MAG: NrdH-redoxin [Candidatus Campbellbacteria bacterium CG22_combo_CG10-13_8_21_14_all_43_18]PIR24486.1 MAG: NrdH-redoxin [Candidatus Campbellbacteria bacterium CG11_big_fil_rev_8_21_14_0_20_44_21]